MRVIFTDITKYFVGFPMFMSTYISLLKNIYGVYDGIYSHM